VCAKLKCSICQS